MLCAGGSRASSGDEGTVDVERRLGPVVFDFCLPVPAEEIETEAIRFRFDDLEESGFEF